MKVVQELKEMINSGVNNLYNFYPQTDKLNVFPVPDGDTGTNMNLTCTNGFIEIEKVEFNSLRELLNKFSRGLIMGARGNSGVIFSQIIKGFSLGFSEDQESFNAKSWKESLNNAKEIAYKAVMKPVEGTILTVIRETAENVNKLSDNATDLEIWKEIVRCSNESLEGTPELLPVLKEVGVVDSGGFGLVKFFEGVLYYLENKKIVEKLSKLEENNGQNVDIEIEDEFGYCTEAIVLLDKSKQEFLKVDTVRNKFEQFGNSSIVAVKDEDILKVHTHALQPGQVLTYLQQFGEFKTIKVENMNLQADSHVAGGNPNVNHKTIGRSFEDVRELKNEVATIAVVGSSELKDYFENDLNVSYAINGGSKMNPSTADFLEAIKKVDAKVVYLFPNDSNVILAAQQAADNETMSKVYVVESKSIPQGSAALISFDEDQEPKKMVDDLSKVMKNVVTYSITEAARDATINGVEVKEGQIMGILDKKIVFSGSSLSDVVTKSFIKSITSKTEIITIFTGANAKMKDILFLRKYLDENCDVEYEVVEGGQDVYDFIIGIE